MLKEALVWSLLIFGIVSSAAVLNTYIEAKKKTNTFALIALGSLFVCVFCSIYLVFRVFWWLNLITSGTR